ncbi:MAG: RNA-binding transcriptional accessory protein [Christensenellaceae bacterium]|nr:RNA-binding transcriptional accessory protein [Christensenellaceae bacterium]
MELINQLIAQELGMNLSHVNNVVALLDEGNSIPFIARYRKELHNSTDDTTLRKLEERLKYLRKLEERRQEVLNNIEAQGKLTEELSDEIAQAKTLAELEDLYAPYKPKRRTRATIAKEKGLEPLADVIFAQETTESLDSLAQVYIDAEKGVETVEDALKGASDIIAEKVSDDPKLRKILSMIIKRQGKIKSENATEDDSVYSQYYDFSQDVRNIQNHQVLALNRGEKEGLLKTALDFDKEVGTEFLFGKVLKNNSITEDFLKESIVDSYDRLLFPAMDRSIRSELTDRANEGAIHNFSLNLKALLMQPPVKNHVTMGLDPGYKNGCKVAVVDPTGKVLDTAVVFPTFGEKGKNDAIIKLSALIKKHKVEHIAIGNGTASRETEQMVVEMIKLLNDGTSYMIVNEAGASVYSASKIAADEFPDFDVNLRSAVSIARRLQDPLAELVKIDPKAIGVGQYQHDMPPKELDDALSAVVEDCVNAVGVDLNTASASLLSYVSGLTASTTKNIVSYREENGQFTSRKELLKVKNLGPKAFEQCAGFLRVPESKNILDNTGVHPESYDAAERVLTSCGFTMDDLNGPKIALLPLMVKQFGEEKLAKKADVGLPTMKDIIQELLKPGRDPRDELPQPVLRSDILKIEDIKAGMTLKGTVRNVIDFGAFVDIGVHEDGLVHISEIANRFIKHPSEVLTVGDVVEVLVLSVDIKKKRISLSIKQAEKSKK